MKDLTDFSSDRLEVMFARRDRDIQRLEQEVRGLRRLLQEVQEQTANHVALLQQQLANRSQDVERLQAQLESQQDYKKIQSELRTLQAQTQTSVDLHGVSPFSVPSEVTCVSVENDPAIQTEVKPPESSLCSGEECVSSGRPVEGSASSPVFVKAELELPDVLEVEPDVEAGLEMELEAEPDVEVESDVELDTVLITERVKETLLSRNIGQRVFGFYILGLSQGSVSDILSRPKPWSKLTSRGRAPFLRMKHFLSDQKSIERLSNIQERLRGIVPWARLADGSSDEAIRMILDQSRMEMLEEDDRRVCDASRSESAIRDILHQAREQMQESRDPKPQVHHGSPGAQSPAHFVQDVIRKVKSELDEDAPLQTDEGGQRWREQEEQPRSCPGDDSGALELDTARITQRVKQTLLLHGIGQRVFGQQVLGLTQSSVSELLSHPKPWNKLSLKGKENFIRMDLWLRDPHNVQKLNAKTCDDRACLKRDFQRQADAMGSEFHDGDSGQYEAVKRPRFILSAMEKEVLLSAYRVEPYPSPHTIENLACQLGLLTSTVSNWFCNYRSRSRRCSYSEPVQVRPAQSLACLSPVSGSSSPASGILVPVKLEASDPEENTERQKDQLSNISVSVQSVMTVKQEKEDPLSF